jgi:Holliday junction resolvase RusA-like endonuclease
MTIHIYYASQRPDLDESLILDLLQGILYKNDRQVRERHVYHFIDKLNPRTEIWIRPRSVM